MELGRRLREGQRLLEARGARCQTATAALSHLALDVGPRATPPAREVAALNAWWAEMLPLSVTVALHRRQQRREVPGSPPTILHSRQTQLRNTAERAQWPAPLRAVARRLRGARCVSAASSGESSNLQAGRCRCHRRTCICRAISTSPRSAGPSRESSAGRARRNRGTQASDPMIWRAAASTIRGSFSQSFPAQTL